MTGYIKNIPYTGVTLMQTKFTMNITLKPLIFLFCIVPILSSCTGIPKGITPVSNFELERYVGKWYEIARLDHSFERGLQAVTAEYSITTTGDVKVLNTGYSQEKKKQNQAEGKARFVGDENIGHLKVSFFGPFYGSYVVFELDDAYEYAFVAGPNKKYLWLLARSPKPDQSIIDSFIARAEALSFPVDELIMVEH